jgi:hydrogenase nickel incorporation protein HypA/HybF
MHEYSIVRALLDRVEAEAASRGATAVRRVEVTIGELSGVEPDLLATAYDTFRAASICRAADLAIRRTPARWGCPRCGSPVERGALLECPACGGPPRLQSGDEIVLERIEMEVE